MAMGKKEMTSVIAEKTGFTQKQAAQFIDAFLQTVEEKLAAGENVQLTGFGTFLTRKRSPAGQKPGNRRNNYHPSKNSAGSQARQRVERKGWRQVDLAGQEF